MKRWNMVLLLAAAGCFIAALFIVRDDSKAPEEWKELQAAVQEQLRPDAYISADGQSNTRENVKTGATGAAAGAKAAEANSEEADNSREQSARQGASGEKGQQAGADGDQQIEIEGDEEGIKASAGGSGSGQPPSGQEERVPAAPAVEGPASDDSLIDINRASESELMTLKGIGKSRAQAIIADRERNGFFRSVEDLQRVKGIGAKMLEKLKPSIVAKP